jgi:uncharacterized protein
MQELLWRFVTEGALTFHDLGAEQIQRIRVLMDQYRDTPMELADASLVTAAEVLDQTRVFSLDQHFRIYRLRGTTAFQVFPD